MPEKKYKKKLRISGPPDPVDWNKPDIDWKVEFDRAGRILEKIKNAPTKTWDRSYKFLVSIETKITDIRKSIDERQKATEGQSNALIAMEKAIDSAIQNGAKS